MFTQAQQWGQQHALQALGLLKQAAYSSWQVEVAKRHYPQFFEGVADEVGLQRMNDAMRVRSQAPPSPAHARMLPPTSNPPPREHWLSGEAEPISTHKADFLRQLQGEGSKPLPKNVLPLTPADVPAEPPHTPPHRRGGYMKEPTLAVSESQIIRPPTGSTGIVEKAPELIEAPGGGVTRAIRRVVQLAQRAR